MDIRESYESYTPARAEEVLNQVRRPGRRSDFTNRRIEPRRVQILARQMSTGKYHSFVPRIAFGEDGKLVDGYHTMLAIIESGTTWELRTQWGVPPEAISAYNESRSGTGADELRRIGVQNHQIVGAVAKLLLNFDCPIPRYSMHTAKNWTSAEVREKAEENLAVIQEAVEAAQVLYPRLHVNRTIAATAYAVFYSQIGPEETRKFFHRLTTGEMLPKGDPVYWLRSKLEKMRPDRTEGLRMAGAGSNRTWIAFLIAGEALLEDKSLSNRYIPRNPGEETVRKYIFWDYPGAPALFPPSPTGT
jgi:hypothetical protein